MRLEKASLNPPEGLREFLIDLGDGTPGDKPSARPVMPKVGGGKYIKET